MLQSILTVVLSGVVAAFVSFMLSSKKETFLYKQKKAEDLFLAAERYNRHLGSIHMLWAKHVKGDLSRNEMDEIVSKGHDRVDTSAFPTLWMLTRFYFPEVEPTLRAFDAKRQAVNSAFFAHERKPIAYKVFDDAWAEFIAAGDALLDAIVLQGKTFQEIPVPLAGVFENYLGKK